MIGRRIKGAAPIENAATEGAGGGIHARGGPTLENSVVQSNLANSGGYGGGIALSDGSSATILGSTISLNTTSAAGGGVFVFGTGTSVDIEASTLVADNQLLGLDDGMSCAGTCGVEDSIAEDICTGAGTLTWGGGNVDAAATTCSGGTAVAAFLNALGYYGGSPTQTHSHAIGSPAFNNATPANCPSTDQRGAGRGVPCDSGAHEAP